jgi:hypothetical protein
MKKWMGMGLVGLGGLVGLVFIPCMYIHIYIYIYIYICNFVIHIAISDCACMRKCQVPWKIRKCVMGNTPITKLQKYGKCESDICICDNCPHLEFDTEEYRFEKSTHLNIGNTQLKTRNYKYRQILDLCTHFHPQWYIIDLSPHRALDFHAEVFQPCTKVGKHRLCAKHCAVSGGYHKNGTRWEASANTTEQGAGSLTHMLEPITDIHDRCKCMIPNFWFTKIWSDFSLTRFTWRVLIQYLNRFNRDFIWYWWDKLYMYIERERERERESCSFYPWWLLFHWEMDVAGVQKKKNGVWKTGSFFLKFYRTKNNNIRVFRPWFFFLTPCNIHFPMEKQSPQVEKPLTEWRARSYICIYIYIYTYSFYI